MTSGIVIARTRNQTPGPILGVEVAADLAHPVVVVFAASSPDTRIAIPFAQRRAALEGKERALQSGMDQSFNRPDFLPVVLSRSDDFRLRAFQDLSTRLDESFQRKPKGGGISSATAESRPEEEERCNAAVRKTHRCLTTSQIIDLAAAGPAVAE